MLKGFEAISTLSVMVFGTLWMGHFVSMDRYKHHHPISSDCYSKYKCHQRMLQTFTSK
jgi:hypothetical protein